MLNIKLIESNKIDKHDFFTRPHFTQGVAKKNQGRQRPPKGKGELYNAQKTLKMPKIKFMVSLYLILSQICKTFGVLQSSFLNIFA